MTYKGYTITVFRMACNEKYPTPFCAVGRRDNYVFNVEGETDSVALERAKQEIDKEYGNEVYG